MCNLNHTSTIQKTQEASKYRVQNIDPSVSVLPILIGSSFPGSQAMRLCQPYMLGIASEAFCIQNIQSTTELQPFQEYWPLPHRNTLCISFRINVSFRTNAGIHVNSRTSLHMTFMTLFLDLWANSAYWAPPFLLSQDQSLILDPTVSQRQEVPIPVNM